MSSTITSVGSKGIAWSLFGAEVASALYDLRWMLILMVAFIGADLWFGCKESNMKRKEAKTKKERESYKFRFSRAGRRTLNKAVDYITYMLLGCIVGFAITEPLGLTDHITTSAIGVCFGCLFELSSILGHIFALHHMKLHIDWRKFVIAFVKTKSEELGDALDESVDISEEKKN